MLCFEIHHFFTRIMFLNTMGALEFRHVVNKWVMHGTFPIVPTLRAGNYAL